ncbi:uncharacterized protein LOC119018250 [Acanthopagrus latus]|uniref:uncharacterized protein LOC119018250 n=1 Tax=Acanthopagrus latus TaxID=8177 RepID=UPI00187C5EEC|nr:uncharacterized protein LOC119018250 [Acanthopagrus latus]
MEAGATLLLLLLSLLSPASTLSFYGDGISFTPLKKQSDGTIKVTLHHRLNGRSDCSRQSSLSCEAGVCTSFNRSSVLDTDEDSTGQDRWCQSEVKTTATVSTTKHSFSLRDSGCCWVSNVNGKTNWMSDAELNLGTRSDSHTLNSCPVTATVSSLRVPQNCFSRLRLLAHDPDGDLVRCKFTSEASVSPNFALDEAACTLTSTGQVGVGVHVFEVTLQDFPKQNITVTYADGTTESDMTASPLCKVKLQFSVEVLPAIPKCEAGHVQPMFLSTTPSHGDVLYATVGQNFLLKAEAQAQHSSIHDFQVSGPDNMTKVFRDEENGKAEVTLSWTPQQEDLYRFVPVCFTAETNETQSDMRCVVVLVTQASLIQGKAIVECSPNKMVVSLEKASMPDIDKNFLRLRDESCSLTSNSTHITGSMSFSTCGTKFEDKGDFIVFNNEINSFELPNEVIVRRKTVKIGFSCQFPKTISISSYYTLKKSEYIFTESSFGSFGYSFEIYRDSNFTNRVEASAYPVQVKLMEPLYIGIQAQSDLPDVKLFVESCKGTPDDNPENALSYDLIRNGCIQDETLKVHTSTNDSFNFEVQAFKFTGNFDQVYITCSVILCEPGSPFSRCAQGCLKTASRRKRDLSKETGSHYIIQGPLQVVGQDVPDAAVDNHLKDVISDNETPREVIPPEVPSDIEPSGGSRRFKEILSTNISTVVFAVGFLVSLVLMAVLVRYFSRKRRAEDRNALIVSGWDN